MAFTKEVTHSIEIKEDGIVNVRKEVKVLDDGEEVATKYLRHVLIPGDDITGEPARIRRIISAAWS